VNAGVPSGVLVSPIRPGLNDEEIPEIFKQAKEHQAMWIGHTIVRLPYAVKDIFLEWVQRLYPDRASKIINRIKDLRGGKLDESRFVKRMTGEGEIASAIHQLVELSRKKYKLKENAPELRTDLFLRVREKQIGLF
jgi:DNA repair photolyase